MKSEIFKNCENFGNCEKCQVGDSIHELQTAVSVDYLPEVVVGIRSAENVREFYAVWNVENARPRAV